MINIQRDGLTYKGTRIMLGSEKNNKISACRSTLYTHDYTEIELPIIQFQSTFASKVGEENNNLMFNFKDRGDRELCLAPEYTAVIQKLAEEEFKNKKDFRLYYVGQCFRGEKPQLGRYRQFTQLGVEILNPTKDNMRHLIMLAKAMIGHFITPVKVSAYDEIIKSITVDEGAKRGLDYYEGAGFEIHCSKLGTASQICGGGTYKGGQGFALGIDRLMLLNKIINEECST